MPSEQHFYGCKSTIFSLSRLKLGYLSFLIHPEIPTYSDAAAPFLHLSVSISHLLSSPTRADVGGHRPRCGDHRRQRGKARTSELYALSVVGRKEMRNFALLQNSLK